MTITKEQAERAAQIFKANPDVMQIAFNTKVHVIHGPRSGKIWVQGDWHEPRVTHKDLDAFVQAYSK